MKPMAEAAQRVLAALKQYKFVVLVLLLGVALLLLPSKSKASAETTADTPPSQSTGDEAYRLALEERLAAVLSEMTGAGRVTVLLTLRTGTQTVFQTDTSITTDAAERSSEERKTVILSRGSAYDEAAASAVEYPQFQGAVVVCEGADDPAVKLGVVNAVSALTGLSSSRITVLKMK